MLPIPDSAWGQISEHADTDATGFAHLDRPSTEAELKDSVEKLKRMGEVVRRFGITMCLHPHFGTTVFREPEIDYMLDHIDLEVLSLCMDTAHTKLAGMEPVHVFRKYFDRIKFVHLKDLDPSFPENEPMKGFRALGEGTIDLFGVVKVLKDSGYDGNLVVECDRQRVCNYESALASRNYIQRVLRM